MTNKNLKSSNPSLKNTTIGKSKATKLISEEVDQRLFDFLQSAELSYNKKSAPENGGSGGGAGVGGAVIISIHPVN